MTNPTEIHTSYIQAWNDRDFAKLSALQGNGFTFVGPDGVRNDPEAAIAIARGYVEAFPDATLTVVRSFTQGNTSIVEIVARGTHRGPLMGIPASGKSVELGIVNIAEIRDGKLVEEREYFDVMTMLTQIGAAGAAGA